MDGWSNSCSSSSSCGSSSFLTPQPPVFPKSSPGGLDLFGKRRQLVKVQILEREIGLLREELKSIEGLQPVSRCCRELNDFIGAKQDLLVAINVEAHKSRLRRKRLCIPWICCLRGCLPHLQMSNCCVCCLPCTSELHICSCLWKIACQSCFKFSGTSCPCFGCCCSNSSLHEGRSKYITSSCMPYVGKRKFCSSHRRSL